MKRTSAPPPTALREPRPEECCGKGCTPCVLDSYAEKLEQYRAALLAWQTRDRTGTRSRRPRR
jgi:hypothetical protein